MSVEALEKTLQVVKERLIQAILATPTGPVRNHLSDANIHVEAAIDQLQQALEGRSYER